MEDVITQILRTMHESFEVAAKHRYQLKGRQDVILAALAILIQLHPNRDVFEAQFQRKLDQLPLLSDATTERLQHDEHELLGRAQAVRQLLG